MGVCCGVDSRRHRASFMGVWPVEPASGWWPDPALVPGFGLFWSQTNLYTRSIYLLAPLFLQEPLNYHNRQCSHLVHRRTLQVLQCGLVCVLPCCGKAVHTCACGVSYAGIQRCDVPHQGHYWCLHSFFVLLIDSVTGVCDAASPFQYAEIFPNLP